MLRTKIGIIGFGNMGAVIAKKVSQKYKVFIFDKDKNKTCSVCGMNIAEDVIDLLRNVDTIILAVKPQDFNVVLNEIKCCLREKLIISIAAGITTKYIENTLGKVKVIRVMPNLPAKIGKGVSCLCEGKFADKESLTFAEQLFRFLGWTLILKENMMDAATAVVGSGPGFFYTLLKDKLKEEWAGYSRDVFIPQLALAAKEVGFSLQQAELLSKLITEGSFALLEETQQLPQTLCIQVTSKGGTTEAGLKALRADAKFLPEAVKAALKRAKELSRK